MKRWQQLTKLEKGLVGVIWVLCMFVVQTFGLDEWAGGQAPTRFNKIMNHRGMQALLVVLGPIPVIGMVMFYTIGGLVFMIVMLVEITREHSELNNPERRPDFNPVGG